MRGNSKPEGSEFARLLAGADPSTRDHLLNDALLIVTESAESDPDFTKAHQRFYAAWETLADLGISPELRADLEHWHNAAAAAVAKAVARWWLHERGGVELPLDPRPRRRARRRAAPQHETPGPSVIPFELARRNGHRPTDRPA